MQSPSELRRVVAGKLHEMHIAMEEIQRENEAERQKLQRRVLERNREYQCRSNSLRNVFGPSMESAQPAQASQVNEEVETECERIRAEANVACERISKRYDSLVKFVTSCPLGNYEEFIEFLLMGGGRTENDVGQQFQDDCSNLLIENFYDEKSDYRKLWNDNLTLGLPKSISAREGRKSVPAEVHRRKSPTSVDGNEVFHWQFSDERLRNFGKSFHTQIAHLDKVRTRQGLGSAIGGVSKALKELQLVDRLKSRNIEGSERCIDVQDEHEEEEREVEELARLKREAIETCLNATSEHLLSFIKERPSAKYHEWIEDLHPENAHEGALLEGLGKTIDHRFFVEVSDHRRIWNDNLFTYLDPNISKGREFVPARARHIRDNGELVVAPDILSGFDDECRRGVVAPQNDADLIEFD